MEEVSVRWKGGNFGAPADVSRSIFAYKPVAGGSIVSIIFI